LTEGGTHVVVADNVGVFEFAQHTYFTKEQAHCALADRRFGEHQLQRKVTPRAQAAGQINRSHPAGTKLMEDFVSGDERWQ
jgi:hypothetical protein